ncbi:MAG: hypothetical protein JWN84_4638 [Nocardioides sp.]|nr:hypothetical protein [Nocardioides sp.]
MTRPTHRPPGRTGCVVVHHRSLDTLGTTLRSIVASGIEPGRLLVVDNSGDAVSTDELRAALPGAARVVRTANYGYGAAVNRGLDMLSTDLDLAADDRVLVATHEVVLRKGTVRELTDVLDDDDRLGAVGPVLVSGDDVWSAGGRLGNWGIPSHAQRVPEGRAATVDWLDGALCLYRWEAISRLRFDEKYFLYFEEVDFHQRLRASGWAVAVACRTTTTQATGGMPPYYAGRNFRMFQRRWVPRGRRPVALARYAGVRLLVLLLRRDLAGLRSFVRGLRGLPPQGADS